MLSMKAAKLTTVQVVVGVVGVTSNIFTMAAAMAFQPSNFAIYLIPVFVGNMLLYLGYYLATKWVTHGECWATTHITFTAFTYLTWCLGLYFLVFKTSISPGIASALSRERETGCLVSDLFDGHDAWHFFSSLGVFFTALLVMVVDDRLNNTQTSHIHMF